MSEKMKSVIRKITLNGATFDNEVIEPTYVNFFYGRNGVGKSTVARTIEGDDGVVWQDGRSASDYDVLVYSQDFINRNFELATLTKRTNASGIAYFPEMVLTSVMILSIRIAEAPSGTSNCGLCFPYRYSPAYNGYWGVRILHENENSFPSTMYANKDITFEIAYIERSFS